MEAPAFVINWVNSLEKNKEYSAKEKAALREFISTTKFPLWKWLKKAKFKKEQSRIIQFLIASVLLKDNTKKEISRGNIRLHLKDSCDRLGQLKGSLTKSEKLLQKNKKLFSRFSVGSSLAIQDSNTFLHIQKSNTKLPIAGFLEGTHGESIETLSLLMRIMIKAIEERVDHTKKMLPVIPAPGKLTGKNAEHLHFCRNLIYQFEQTLGKPVSPRVIWSIYQIIYSSEAVLEESRIKKLLHRQNISKK